MERLGAAAVILNDRNEVLLVHHTYGELNWEIPGGMGEIGESPQETAVREVREETTLEVRAVATTGWYYCKDVDKMGAVFLCEVISGEIKPDGAEISECRYWPIDNLPRPISAWTIQRIQDALAHRMPLPTVIGPRVWFR